MIKQIITISVICSIGHGSFTGQHRHQGRSEWAPRDHRTCNIDDIQKVIRATYGTNMWSDVSDVTDTVKSIVHRNGGTLKLDDVSDSLNEIFGDPNHGFEKKLIVDYIEGRRMSVTIPEYDLSDIHSIGEVLFASYGAPNHRTRSYYKGDSVTALHKNGNWYGATISSIQSDGKYFLNWDDGDESDRVKSANKIDGAVTSKVRDMVSGGTLRLVGSRLNAQFGDPAPKVVKVLTVDYIPAESVTIGEYGGYDIPDVKKVISATYGAGNKRICVTYPVRSMLRGGTLRLAGFRKNAPDSMNNHFTDPVPFIEKELKILYILGGRRRLAANCAEMELRNVISTYKNLHATREKSARRTRNIHR